MKKNYIMTLMACAFVFSISAAEELIINGNFASWADREITNVNSKGDGSKAVSTISCPEGWEFVTSGSDGWGSPMLVPSTRDGNPAVEFKGWKGTGLVEGVYQDISVKAGSCTLSAVMFGDINVPDGSFVISIKQGDNTIYAYTANTKAQLIEISESVTIPSDGVYRISATLTQGGTNQNSYVILTSFSLMGEKGGPASITEANSDEQIKVATIGENIEVKADETILQVNLISANGVKIASKAGGDFVVAIQKPMTEGVYILDITTPSRRQAIKIKL